MKVSLSIIFFSDFLLGEIVDMLDYTFFVDRLVKFLEQFVLLRMEVNHRLLSSCSRWVAFLVLSLSFLDPQ